MLLYYFQYRQDILANGTKYTFAASLRYYGGDGANSSEGDECYSKRIGPVV